MRQDKKYNKLSIEETRKWLQIHSKYFSSKNNCKPEEIKSGKKYYLVGDCGHEFESIPQNVIYNNEFHCSVCSNKIVVPGINDISATAPELVKYLKNKEDAFKYTKNSNVKLEWKCPDCNDEWNTSPNKMSQRKQLCRNCGDYNKYPEKFVSCFLDQLCECYNHDVEFDWSDKKRYDFYLPIRNLIIETHGKQHYNGTFCHAGSRSIYEEQENDSYKKELALKHGISEYIVLDCSKSEIEWIKHSIRNSSLRALLMFDMEDINWNECEKNALCNVVKMVCEDYKNGFEISQLIEKYKRSLNSIKLYLKQGAKFDWCLYDPEVSKQKGIEKNVKSMIERTSKKVVQKDMDGNIIRVFDSLNGAQRELNISHIWDCITGRRKTAGGYKWEYYET